MVLIFNWFRALIIGIKMLEAWRPYGSGAADWARSGITQKVWQLVAASLYVQPIRARVELCYGASKISVAALLDVGFQLIARMDFSVH